MSCPVQTLDDLLADPLVQVLMRADHVETVALRRMLTGVAARQGNLAVARVRFSGQMVPTSADPADDDAAEAPVRC